MNKFRLEIFSDGVMAIIITIMVLELKVPHNTNWASLRHKWPEFISYALSFVFVALYWFNHYHLFQMVTKVSNKILWINLLGLFWLSLIPFSAAWMGQNSFQSTTVTLYAIILTLLVANYMILVHQLRLLHDLDSAFSKNFKGYFKGYLTISINLVVALLSSLGMPNLAFILLLLTALLWFIPNHRFESKSKIKSL